jgi:hypothetical protein
MPQGTVNTCLGIGGDTTFSHAKDRRGEEGLSTGTVG